VQPRWAQTAGLGLTAPRPVLDGCTLPRGPAHPESARSTREFELLIGSNRDEAKLFLSADPARGILDESRVRRRLSRLLREAPEDPDALIEIYRAARRTRGESTHPWELYRALISDRMIRVSALQFLEAHVRAGGRGFSFLVTWESPLSKLGSCHAIELPLVFGTLEVPGIDRFMGSGPEAEQLGEAFRESWTSFARGEGPGAPALGTWPPYEPEGRATLIFGPGVGSENAPREPERAAWADLLGAA